VAPRALPVAPPPGWRALPEPPPGVGAWVSTDASPELRWCPRCGAMATSPASPCEACGAPTPPAGPPAVAGPRRRCGGCGAGFAGGEERSPCSICGGPVPEPAALDEAPTPPPIACAPFTVSADAARQAVARWTGNAPFRPRELRRLARADGLRPVFVPCWLFTAGLDAEWRGRVGRERIDRDRDADTGLWRTRTVVDWRWQTGRVRRPSRTCAVPATRRLPDAALAPLLDPFDLSAFEPLGPEPPPVPALIGDVALADAWAAGRARMRAEARGACEADLPAPRVRDLSVVADLVDESWRQVLVPVWVGVYRDQGRPAVVLVHGRTGAVAGRRTVDWFQVRAAVTVALVPGIALVLAGVPLLPVLALGVPVLLFGLLLLALGGAVVGVAWSRAVAAEVD
jgi:hypothetical protein